MKTESDRKLLEHMQHRRGHGLTYRELADEFDVSKSQIHRKLTGEKDEEPQKRLQSQS